MTTTEFTHAIPVLPVVSINVLYDKRIQFRITHCVLSCPSRLLDVKEKTRFSTSNVCVSYQKIPVATVRKIHMCKNHGFWGEVPVLFLTNHVTMSMSH